MEHLKYNPDTGHLLYSSIAHHLTYDCPSSSSSSFGESSSSSSSNEHHVYVPCHYSSSSESSSSSDGYSSSSSEGNWEYFPCESESSSSEDYSESSSTSSEGDSSSSSESSDGTDSESSSSEQPPNTSSESSSSDACPTGLFCNCPEIITDPTVEVTLSWTDADISKSAFGCDWCNGETKRVCPDNYVCNAYASPSTGQEKWSASAGGDALRLEAYVYSAGPNFRMNVNMTLATASPAYGNWHNWDGNPFSYTSSIALHGMSPTGWTLGNNVIDKQFGSYTTQDGITIIWARDSSGNWGC